MLLFQSGEEIREWCRARGRRPGAIVDLARLARLASAWYGNRLDPDWRPRTLAQSQRLLEQSGLSGPFWRLD